MVEGRLPSSFRDPSGFVFVHQRVVYRQINRASESDWRLLATSGLYENLVRDKLVLAYESVSNELALTGDVLEVIRPERIPLVSYPYEWCFSQLKDAALLTLEIMRRALRHGMWLKDATAYNVQFFRGAPVHVDTLSFEAHREGEPWPAYGQFCRHFLAPLALAAFVDIRLFQMLRTHIDGIPLDLAVRMLPRKTRMNFGLLTHLHLHARAEGASGGAQGPARAHAVSLNALLGMIDSLESAVRKLSWQAGATTWGDYYDHTNYTNAAFEAKGRLVAEFVDAIVPTPQTAWDLGANTGHFSEILADKGIETGAWDSEYEAIERAYRRWREKGKTNLLPLVQDFANPSPSLGWAHEERESLAGRGPVDVTLALALLHHLAIANNVPLPEVADWLRSLGAWSIVEFVPKEDSQVQKMLSTRRDIFDDYTEAGFEAALSDHFAIVRRERIPGTERTLYLLQGKAS